MTPEQFVYWLQGFFEISNENKLSPVQVLTIKDHLNLVFNKKTPFRTDSPPASPPPPPKRILKEGQLSTTFPKDLNVRYCSSGQLSAEYKDTKVDVSC